MKELLVSLHDVTPAMEDRSRRAADIIMERTGPRFTMLVVPDFHSRGGLTLSGGFSSWLREMQALGVEIAQHGFTHMDPSGGRTLSARLLTRGEGEFSSLKAAEAAERIGAGLRIMADALGRPPAGFTAPAWLYGRGTMEALRSFPFEWIEHRSFIDLGKNGTRRAPVMVFASRTLWKRAVSRLWSRAAPAVFGSFPLVRLAVHVRDLPDLETQVAGVMDRCTRGRKCIRCGELAHTSF